ncbi:hypothetical protein GGS20DRAFT_599656 [Poronia punctata]|nr:hypothetical protein GGS20DRAFT_599656 [Poronia punctata]
MPSQRPNPVRRPHSKSRTGCRVCKSRRVKGRKTPANAPISSFGFQGRHYSYLVLPLYSPPLCDETRPSCRRCITHGAQCDFALEAEASTSQSQTPQEQGSRDALSIPQLTSPSAGSTPEVPYSTWFNVSDMELFHHYIISTSLTLASEPVARNFWRVNVPQSGFSNHYVLKAILAISALHLARLRPQQKESYVEQALVHHSAAYAMAVPLITQASGDHFAPVFHFSMLTTIITFAKPRSAEDLLVISHGILPDWLVITRGLRTLVESGGETAVSSASLDALFYEGMQLQMLWEQQTQDHEALITLESNIRARTPAHKLPALEEGLLSLRRSYNVCFMNNMTGERQVRATLIWMVKLTDEFADLIKVHDSEALCILAYYCVLLKRLEHLWWVEGWAFHLIEQIYKTLDAKYRLWIQWPLEEIGWAP